MLRMDSLDNDEPWSIFSLTENLTNSYVDQSKLISYVRHDESKIGMDNFKSKKQNRFFGSASNTRTLTDPTKLSQSAPPLSAAALARNRWKAAAKKVRMLNDPWAEFDIEVYPAEHAVRHRYNAIKKKWIQDECIVKIESAQFACGAMRGCFRL